MSDGSETRPPATRDRPPVTVTAVVVAWGESGLLSRCVTSVLASSDVVVDVVVVDNGASPEAIGALPDDQRVRVLPAGGNLGFGGGCNLGASKAEGEFLAFVNPDAVVAPGALSALTEALADPAVGIATARLRLMEDPDLLNSSGGAMHYLGLGWAQGFRAPASSASEPREVIAGSGASMAMRTEVFHRVGGFTPEYFLYQEDLELGLRVWLAGLKVVFVPHADVWHDYAFDRNPQKYYFVERNRLLLVACIYQRRTLVRIAPALVLLEVAMVLLALAQGWLPQKIRGWLWIVQNRRWVLEHRRVVQASRRLGDDILVPLIESRFTAGQVGVPSVVRPVDWVFGKYWELVRRA